jgi:hypothetical protein
MARQTAVKKPPTLNQAYRQVEALLSKLFGTNNGDDIIEFILIDRRTHERMHYEPVPYAAWVTEEDPTPEQQAQRYLQTLRIQSMNHSIASEALDRDLRSYIEVVQPRLDKTKQAGVKS